MKSGVKVNLLQYVALQLSMLKYSGLWFFIPHPVKSFKFWVNVLYRILVGILVFVLPTGGQILSLRKFITGEMDIQEAVSIINLVLVELLTSFKLLDLCLRRHLLMKLVDQMNNEEFSSIAQANLDVIQKSIRFTRRFSIAYFCLGAGDVFVHVLLVPALRGFETLPLKIDFLFFDVNDYFQFMYAYQILYKPIMLIAICSLQTLVWSAMIFTIGQLDILIQNIENMEEFINVTKFERKCGENEAFESIFKKCLRHHSLIKRFVNTLQATFSGQLTSTLALIAAIICTIALQMLSIESPLQNVVELFWVSLFFLLFLGMLYIDCSLGNYITVKSGRISTAMYSCPWVNLKPELKKSVLLFIFETQRPLVIRAGMGLLPVSLDTFTKVMNWTYKGFALINQMKE